MPEIIQIGSLTLRLLRDASDTGGRVDLFEMEVAAEGRMPVAHHHRDWEETVYGLAGCLTFTLDGVAHDIRPGDSVFVPRGVVHGFANGSGAVAKCLVMLTPSALLPGYFRELAAAAAGGPPDAAVMRRIMERYGLVPAP